jgi:hypothetical protein
MGKSSPTRLPWTGWLPDYDTLGCIHAIHSLYPLLGEGILIDYLFLKAIYL